MNINLIIIGNEILSGRTSEKNGLWLGRFLAQKGLQLTKVVIVEDKLSQISQAINFLWPQSDLLILSGGLGPTRDDITKASVANFFSFPLEENQQAEITARENYERKKITFKKQANYYHVIPKGMQPLSNPQGLAPGFFKKFSNASLVCLPGVPLEFKVMMEEVVWPLLSIPSSHFDSFTIRTCQIKEENIFYQVAPDLWAKLEKYGRIASLPQSLGVDIRIDQIPVHQFSQFKEEITQLLKQTGLIDYVWSLEDQSLEETVLQEAVKKEMSLGLAESCTGGLLGHRLTQVPGSSKAFYGSIVSYSNSVKTKILHVGHQTLQKHGAVSEETAKEMAIGSAQILDCDVAISLTGIAGPEGGSPKKPVGTLMVGYFFKGHSGGRTYHLKGDRKLLQHLFSQVGLFTLLGLLRGKNFLF